MEASCSLVGDSVKDTLKREVEWISDWALELSDALEKAKSGLNALSEACTSGYSLSAELHECYGGRNKSVDYYEVALRAKSKLDAIGSMVRGLRDSLFQVGGGGYEGGDKMVAVRKGIAKIVAEANGDAPVKVDSWKIGREVAECLIDLKIPAEEAHNLVFITFELGFYPIRRSDCYGAIKEEIRSEKFNEDSSFSLCFTDEKFFEACGDGSATVEVRDYAGTNESPANPSAITKRVSVLEALQKEYPKMRCIVYGGAKWHVADAKEDTRGSIPSAK